MSHILYYRLHSEAVKPFRSSKTLATPMRSFITIETDTPHFVLLFAAPLGFLFISHYWFQLFIPHLFFCTHSLVSTIIIKQTQQKRRKEKKYYKCYRTININQNHTNSFITIETKTVHFILLFAQPSFLFLVHSQKVVLLSTPPPHF